MINFYTTDDDRQGDYLEWVEANGREAQAHWSEDDEYAEFLAGR